jgi:serine/threonine protein kinase
VRSGQPVAIKLFPPEPAATALWETARREVRVVTNLRHNAILPVFSCTLWRPDAQTRQKDTLYDWQTPTHSDEYLLTLCQYVPGTLSGYLAHYEQIKNVEQTPSLLMRVINLIKQMGSALSAAHERGIVHGALVPGNVLLDSQEHLWIADFGLARLQPPMAPFLAPELEHVAKTGAQTGKAHLYWDEVTPASDQYALAIVCEQLVTRLLPAGDYEPALSVLQCAMQPNPARRFASVEIFVHEYISQLTRDHATIERQTSSLHLSARPTSSAEWQLSYPQASGYDNERYEKVMSYQLASSAFSAPVENWEKRGDKLFTMRDYSGAASAYQRALDVDNGKASTWLALGDACLALENYSESLRAYEYAMQLNPNDPLAWSNRGTALDALGRHKEAMDCYERASQLR